MRPVTNCVLLGGTLLAISCGNGKGGSPGDETGLVPRTGLPSSPRVQLVRDENLRAGDPSWAIRYGAGRTLEGYASRISVRAGESVDVSVNVDAARRVHWALFRTGWYGGAGARRVLDGGTIDARPQPACPRDPVTSRVECAWLPALSLTVPAEALSGVYLLKLSADDGRGAYVPLVVRDGRAADVLLDVNVLSWQAYNAFGGESLYEDASGTMPSGKAFEVSFDRPFIEGNGAGRFLYWEVYLVRYLEALGYDVTYTTGIDLGAEPEVARRVRLFLSAANDEYWTPAARDAIEAAQAAGVNLAFLGADQVLWRVRLGPSSRGAPDRVVACYKSNQDRDPVLAEQGSSASTARFREPPDARPENGLIGVMYAGWMVLPQPLVITNPSSWVFAGTGLGTGDALPQMVSDEADARVDNGAEPPGLESLAISPIVDAHGLPQRAAMTWYRATSGAEVVGVGTIGWASGLGKQGVVDSRVARITRNVLDRFVGEGHGGDPDPAGAPWVGPQATAQVVGAWARTVETVAGAPDTAAPSDGPGVSARFRAPSGVAVGPDGSVYVSDAAAHQIRRIAADAARTVSTWAGDGIDGARNGPGASARFRWPAGLAVGHDGSVYVADAENHVIRRIAPDPAHTVETWAGTIATAGGLADGPAASARFNEPVAIAVAPDGALLVADMHNHRVRRVDPGSRQVTTYAGSTFGFADGPAASSRFGNPSGIAASTDGTVFVLDTSNHAIRRIGADAARTVITIAGGDPSPGPLVDGAGAVARLGGQAGLACRDGRLYFSDVVYSRIRAIDAFADAASTRVYTFAGDGGTGLRDGDGANARFSAPLGIAVAPDGSVYLADSGTQAVRRLRP